jgi:hypothetical protein
VHPQSYRRVRWFRFAVGAFALALMVFTALHAPVSVLAASGQHTAGSSADHARQPCLDAPGFDWTVPQSGVRLLLRTPRRVQRAFGLNLVTYSPGPTEFRLYNRPPPLS